MNFISQRIFHSLRYLFSFFVLLSVMLIHSDLRAADTACGEPTFDPAIGPIMYIWQDCTGTGDWHVRFTGEKPSVRFAGSVTSTIPFKSVTGVYLESTDILDNTNSTVIDFTMSLNSPWIDGFNFSVSHIAELSLQVSQPGAPVVLLGAEKKPAPMNPSLVSGVKVGSGVFYGEIFGSPDFSQLPDAGGATGETAAHAACNAAFPGSYAQLDPAKLISAIMRGELNHLVPGEINRDVPERYFWTKNPTVSLGGRTAFATDECRGWTYDTAYSDPLAATARAPMVLLQGHYDAFPGDAFGTLSHITVEQTVSKCDGPNINRYTLIACFGPAP